MKTNRSRATLPRMITTSRLEQTEFNPSRLLKLSTLETAGRSSYLLADRKPVIGFDAKVPQFFWAVGQGGIGIMTAPALASASAGLILEKKFPELIDHTASQKPTFLQNAFGRCNNVNTSKAFAYTQSPQSNIGLFLPEFQTKKVAIVNLDDESRKYAQLVKSREGDIAGRFADPHFAKNL